MSSKEDGAMIVLSSPSGAGKTTLTKLLSKNNNYLISVSHTTRKPRINEVDAKDYFFVNEDEFKLLMNEEVELDDELQALRDEPADTKDGHNIKMMVNTGLAA